MGKQPPAQWTVSEVGVEAFTRDKTIAPAVIDWPLRGCLDSTLGTTRRMYLDGTHENINTNNFKLKIFHIQYKQTQGAMKYLSRVTLRQTHYLITGYMHF